MVSLIVECPLSITRLGVRSTATEWIAVALFGQERSLQPSGQEANFGFRSVANYRHPQSNFLIKRACDVARVVASGEQWCPALHLKSVLPFHVWRRRQRGAVVPGPSFKICAPISRLAPRLLHTCNIVFKNVAKLWSHEVLRECLWCTTNVYLVLSFLRIIVSSSVVRKSTVNTSQYRGSAVSFPGSTSCVEHSCNTFLYQHSLLNDYPAFCHFRPCMQVLPALTHRRYCIFVLQLVSHK